MIRFCLALYVSLALSSVSLSAATFTGIGLPSGEVTSSYATDISTDGLVIVGSSHSNSGSEAFRTGNESEMNFLGFIDASYNRGIGSAVSSDGSVIVGNNSSDFDHQAFRWTSSGMVGLGKLPGDLYSYASDVSGDGNVVVGSSYTDSTSPEYRNQAYRWTTDGMLGLGYLPGGEGRSGATAVSEDGAVVVGSSGTAEGSEAFRWSNGVMVGLGYLPGGESRSGAIDVSADGTVIIGSASSASGFEAFRWTSEGMVGLGNLPDGGFESFAQGISADGKFVVGQASIPVDTPSNPWDDYLGFRSEAFVWDEVNGMRSVYDILVDEHGLDLTGWTLLQARAISGDGTVIAGIGSNPSGQRVGWVANLSAVPEPSSLFLVMFAGVGFLLVGRGRYLRRVAPRRTNA